MESSSQRYRLFLTHPDHDAMMCITPVPVPGKHQQTGTQKQHEAVTFETLSMPFIGGTQMQNIKTWVLAAKYLA